MMYPLDLMRPDVYTNEAKPYVLLTALEVEVNQETLKSLESNVNTFIPRGTITLPMPTNSLMDSTSHTFDNKQGLLSSLTTGLTPDAALSMGARAGIVVDPSFSQVYNGSNVRNVNMSWNLVPRSRQESSEINKILKFIKFASSPESSQTGKLGFLKSPYVWKVTFSNSETQALLDFNELALVSLDIEQMGSGNSATFRDGSSKNIHLSMSFAEFGLKYKHDFKPSASKTVQQIKNFLDI